MHKCLEEEIDIIILCGGLGKRLRPVISDRPKPMAEINKQPFLDILIEYVTSYGFKRFILCIGYKGSIIKKHYEETSKPLEILFSEEKEPLGTGGAIKKAESLIQSNPFLVMNGDSFCKLNLLDFLNSHIVNKALLSVALIKTRHNQNCGKVILDRNQRIVEFDEKGKSQAESFSSAGSYLMEKEIFSMMGDKKIISLEYDLFPSLLSKACYGYVVNEDLIDIGTPRNYKKAKQVFCGGCLDL